MFFSAEKCTADPADWLLDWFIWGEVGTAVLLGHSLGEMRQLKDDAEARDAMVEWDFETEDDGTVTLLLPVARYNSEYVREVEVPARLTLHELLTAIHNFYATPITLENLADREVCATFLARPVCAR